MDARITLGYVVVDEHLVPDACFRDDTLVPGPLEDGVHRVGEVLWRHGGLHGGSDAVANTYMFWDHCMAWRGVMNVERGAYFELEPCTMYTVCRECVDVLAVHARSDLRGSYHFSVRDAVYIQATRDLRDAYRGADVGVRARPRDARSYMDDDGPSSLSEGASA